MTAEALAPAVEGFRLSPQQRRLREAFVGVPAEMLLARAQVDLEGPLDAAALSAALDRAVERHEILRTTFAGVPGAAEPVQVVGSPYPVALDGGGPGPLAALLVKVGPTRHRLSLALPALCADAIGIRSLVRELAVGPSSGGDEGPPQYADLAEVFNELVERPDGDVDAFWRAAAAGSLDVPRLPWRAASPPAGAPVVGVARPLPELAGLAASLDRPAAVVLLAAWGVVLGRVGGRSRPVVGCAFDGRDFEGLDEAVGLFSRYLPVGVRVAGGASFSTLVEEVAEGWSAAAERQDGFLLAGGGDSFFPACLEELPPALELQAGPVRWTLRNLDCRFDRYGLRLVLQPLASGAVVRLDAEAGRYPRRALEHLVGAVAAVCRHAVRQPGAAVERLDLLGEEQRRRVIVEWNRAAPAEGETVPGRFAAVLARGADRLAVRGPGVAWSYRELAARSAAVARALAARGIAGEDVVGVAIERRPELLAALLGVLRCGAAFLPLDPDAPAARTAAMLDDAGVGCVLGVAEPPAELPEGVEWLPLPRPVDLDESFVDAELDPRQLAYLLYTSGSTGRPKGVEVSHDSLDRYLSWVNDHLLEGTGRPLPVVARPTFDASLKQLLAPVVRGDAAWFLSAEELAEPRRLAEALAGAPGAGINCVPSLWRALVEEVAEGAAAGGPASVMLGGEALDPEMLATIRERLPAAQVWNLYGPTEVTANATAARLETDEPPHLGRPLPGRSVYLLDRALEPVVPGQVGEICVGGCGIARGYRRRPRATAEAFVPDPLSGAPGARLYRTGDLARFRLDDRLEFVGRRDDQVKVRGVRVELGEVEAALRSHPAVREAAVTFRPLAAGEPALVAYAVVDGKSGAAELRAFLAERLPEPMRPAALVLLPELPRTSGGKVDRPRLPEPSGLVEDGSSPRSQVEEVLAELWCEVLGVERVGREDGFHALGGHSLTAVRLLSKVQRVFSVEVPLREILEAGDLAGMAERIEAARGREGGSAPPPLVPRPTGAEAPLSFSQERLWFLHQVEPLSSAYNIPAALHLRGPLDVRALRGAFTWVTARHEVLRTNYPVRQGGPLRVVRSPGPVALPVVDLGGLPPERRPSEVRRALTADSRRAFDLAREPLLRHAVLRLDDDEWYLMATCHHVVSDGWSMRVLFAEAAAAYEDLREGRRPRLPPLPIQYADYAAWQRRWLQGEELERRRDFWRRRLSGSVPTDLTPDRARPAVQTSARGGSVPWRLEAEDVSRLRTLARVEGATLFMVMLAGLDTTLHHLTGSADIVLGIHTVNRHRPETERVVGLFANQLVLRMDLSGDPTFAELVGRVRQTVLEAFDHQEVPLNVVVEAVRPQRDAGRNPLFQMMFPYQNLPEPPTAFASLQATPVLTETRTSPFDLSVHVRETADTVDGRLRYNRDLFEPVTMERCGDLFAAALRCAVAQPEVRLSQLREELEREEQRRGREQAAALEQSAEARLTTLRRRRRRATA